MRLAPLILAALGLLTLFTGLDRVGVLDEREARDTQVVREMIGRDEILTPLLGGGPLFEKPLPGYAPEFLAQFLDPRSPARSRQVRAALAVLLVLVTGMAGARHFGPRAGMLAAGVLLTTAGLPLAARVDGTALLGACFAWLGCEGLADVVFGRARGRDLRLVFTWSALALALLCAGPLPALWPVAGLALYLMLARDREDWRRARPLAGLALMLGLALPWYGAMFERNGAAFLAQAMVFPYGAAAPGAWYAGIVLAAPFLVLGFFPWSALLSGATLHAASWWRSPWWVLRVGSGGPELVPAAIIERERREEGAAHFFVACMLAALLPIVFFPARPLTAALPALPAAALLVGRLLDHLLESPERLGKLLTRALLMLAAVGSVAAIAVALLASRVPAAGPELRLLATLVLVGSWAPFLADLVGRRRLAALLVGLPVTLGAPVVSLRVLPAMEDWLNTRTAAHVVEAVAPARAPLLLADPPAPSLRCYTRRNLVVASPVPDTLRLFRAEDGMTYLAFRPSREREVAREADTPLEILARTPTLVVARVKPE